MPRERCPICGKGFVGKLHDHLNKNAAASGVGSHPVTRCEWNLNTARIERAVERLRAAGWVRAESVAARVISTLNDPELATYGPTGQTHLWVSSGSLLPENWPRVWWTRPWVRALAEVDSWPMVQRRQIIREVKDAPQEVRDTIEAVYRIGGPKAAAELGPEIVQPRCLAAVPVDVHLAKTSRATKPKQMDVCVLHRDHPPGHRGLRGTRWT